MFCSIQHFQKFYQPLMKKLFSLRFHSIDIFGFTQVKQKFRYPFYTEIAWYVLAQYLCCMKGKQCLERPPEDGVEVKSEPIDIMETASNDEDSRPSSRCYFNSIFYWHINGVYNQQNSVIIFILNLIMVYPDISYPYTRLGTNPHSSTESDSLIQKFSYPDSQSGNEGVRISEVWPSRLL